MAPKRSVTVAAGISAAFLASGTALAVSNGVFGASRAEHVGTFRPIEARLTPARSVVDPTLPRAAAGSLALSASEEGPPTTPATASSRTYTLQLAPPTAAPLTHSTASTVPSEDHADEHETSDDTHELDD
jgi:hypothetical protein